ncbi:hypothetical protein [Amycolatopsis sp. lyj-112]|uniref:hypothetical protein n=1 Tax=Amycolatopsis sp. lyj-112 TaxID=2789288 RepID=UPI00397C481B
MFRPAGRSIATPDYDAYDVIDEFEQAMLALWWEEVAEGELVHRGRTPSWVQRALYALSRVEFFSGLSERILIGSLKQLRIYFTEPRVRDRIRQRVLDSVTAETRVLVGHSLGSVVAYEALCAEPDLPVTTFVTLGSPLGIPNLVFDRLEPEPGRWPNVDTWTNISDQNDIVALVKKLQSPFGAMVADISIHNGAKAHDVRPYLTARETGGAIRRGLDPSKVS